MIMIRKVFFVWNMDKEKEWLESKAREGYILQKVRIFKYYFTKEEPQDLVYQFDFQIMSRKNEEDYLSLFKDWTLVSRLGGWYYFRKSRVNDVSDSIYNDYASKATMFKRLIGFVALCGFPLYFQLIIVFPNNIEPSEFEFPQFYFFIRIIVTVFLVLHAMAMIRLVFIMRKYRNKISD